MFKKKTDSAAQTTASKKERNQALEGLMGLTMDKIRDMVDVQTIIGDKIQLTPTTAVVPISKVSYGFASGGSDLSPKSTPRDLFGGGAGAGVTITPIGFLVSQGNSVRFMPLEQGGGTVTSAIRAVPDVVDRVTDIIQRKKVEKESGMTAEEAFDAASDILSEE